MENLLDVKNSLWSELNKDVAAGWNDNGKLL